MTNVKPAAAKRGSAYYKGLYQKECKEVISLNRQLTARKAENKSLHDEIDRLLDKKNTLQLDNEQLEIEACRSLDNLAERNYYRRSARCWAACSMLMLVCILVLAVSL